MNLTRALCIVAAMAALGLVWPGTASAQFILYSDFGGSAIDPSKFFVNDTIGGSSTPTTETLHILQRGRLRQLITQYGGVGSSSGRAMGAGRLSIDDPTGITAMQARVIVTRAEAQACATNAETSFGSAEVNGRFFNDGTSTGAGDQTGEISAVTRKVFDAVAGAVIEAGIFRCVDASCSATSSVVPVQTFNTGWAFNKAHTMTLLWDPANDRFLHSVKPVFGPEETVILSYAGILPSDTDPPVLTVGTDNLVVRALTANCAGDRKRVVMEALFDDLMIIRE